MGDLPQVNDDDEEVPALVGVAGASNDDALLQSATTHLQDSSLAKVPLTIVTGT